ncbi:MAG: hypothetical protein K8W52_03750 [Deltaproteobacteria bacterium]|nr:hypothetical protein [Deltaproteobacteria bacterium]
MAGFDPSALPEIPDVQLRVPDLTVPGYHPPGTSFLPPLTLDAPTFTGPGGGSPASIMAALGHHVDMPADGPTMPDLTAPVPGGPRNRLQLNGLGPISGAVNPWLADPMGVAEEAERERNRFPRIDPGLAAQQTTFSLPTVRF